GLHAELLGIDRVQRVLGIDEGGNAARFLHLGDEVQRDRGFPRGLGAEDLGDPAARNAADAQGGVKRDGARRNHGDLQRCGLAHRRMMAPLPNCRSIWAIARPIAFSLPSLAPFTLGFNISTSTPSLRTSRRLTETLLGPKA